MAEAELTTWMFMDETPVPVESPSRLLPGEQVLGAYSTFRHQALITTERIIVRDARDVSGESVVVFSLPFATVLMWSMRSAGLRGFTSEINLVTLAGDVTIRLGRDINVERLEHLVAQGVLRHR